MPGAGQCRALAFAQLGGFARAQSGFKRERMMHQSDQPARGRERLGFRGEHPEGEAVDHDRVFAGKLGDVPLRRGPRRRGGAGKALPDVEHLYVPARAAQLRDDAAVIGVAAGRCRKIARHHEHDLLHHNGASCQALAEGDSKTVMRIAAISWPSRPSLPARASAAS